MGISTLLAVFATASPLAEPTATKAAWGYWQSCIQEKAKRFAHGPDGADLVASSVVEVCRPLLNSFLESDDDRDADPKKRAEILVIKNAMRDGYAQRAYREALAIIIEARSK
jgi:hypothetical protein